MFVKTDDDCNNMKSWNNGLLKLVYLE